MSTVISAKDLESLLARNGSAATLPADAVLTPEARDLLWNLARRQPAPAPAPAPAAGAPLHSRSAPAQLEAFFHSPAALALKEQICAAGHRLWQRAYVDGNGGNMAVRVGTDIALCTPTLVSKGSLQPADICLVDFAGNQLLGAKRRTSEILMHLQIMQRQPKAVATCHCHPPHATAFALTGTTPPACLLPEYEIFCAVAVAPYRTPGSPEMGRLVADLVDRHDTILMANHGVVSWSQNSIEEAYWRMEIVEAYCHTVAIAAQLARPLNNFTPPQMDELLKIKKTLGFVDPRLH